MFYLESLNNKFTRYVSFEFLCDKDLTCAQLRAFLSVRYFTTKRVHKTVSDFPHQAPLFRWPNDDLKARRDEVVNPLNEISYILEIPARQEVLHNDNGPALLLHDRNHTLRSENYYCYDKLHNYHGPATRVWDACGRLICEKWYKHGILHREPNLPAVIWYNDRGQICAEEWFYNGEHYRRGDNPAYIKYSERREATNLVVRDNATDNRKLNESILPYLTEALIDLDKLFQHDYDCEEYYYDGKLHRTEQPGHMPAVIKRDRGRITYLGFYWGGMRSRAHTQIPDEAVEKWRNTEIKMQDIFNIQTGFPTELEFFYDHVDGLEAKITWRFHDMLHRDHDDLPAIVYCYRGGATKYEYYYMGMATMYTIDGPETAYGVQNSAGGAYKASYGNHSHSSGFEPEDNDRYITREPSSPKDNELFIRLLYAKKLAAGITSEAMPGLIRTATDDDSENRMNILFEIHSYKTAYGYGGNIEDLLSADARREVESTLENFLSR